MRTDISQSYMPLYKGDKEISGLQILKFICALLVVQIHTYSSVKEVILPVTRIAVPIFFMITGYFLPNAYGEIREEKLKRMFIKILKLEIIAFSVYFVFFLVECRLFHPENYSQIKHINYWLHLAIVGDKPRGHLWYLVALMQSILIILVSIKLRATKWLYLLIPIGLSMNLICGTYNFLLPDKVILNNLFLSRNVFTIALPSILIGLLLRLYEDKLPSTKKIIILTLIGVIGIYVETIILQEFFPQRSGDIIIMTIPVCVCVFVLFLRLSVNSCIGKKMAKYGKAYSTDIYLWHGMVWSAVVFLLSRIVPIDLMDFQTLIIFLVTLIIAAILNRLNRTNILRKVSAKKDT